MRLIQKIILAIFLTLLVTAGYAQTNVMTFNIRYDNPNDGDNWWENRKPEVVEMIDFYHPEIVGVQEALMRQLAYMNNHLPDYSYVGVGRDDGKQKGEFSAILFDTTKLDLVETRTFWLSPTPYTVSIGWDAFMERICTYGVFSRKGTFDTLFVFNCHYDHIGEIARRKSSQLILEKINEFGLSDKQVVVMGDLNSEPEEEPIQVLRGNLDDAREISIVPPYGPEGTFNAFDVDSIVSRRIDYIFVRNLKVNTYRHVDDRRRNNLHLSDHLPVMVGVVKKPCKQPR